VSQLARPSRLFAVHQQARWRGAPSKSRPVYVNRSLLLLRTLVGLLFVGHGLQKVTGWFGGPGMTAWTQSVAKDGLQPAIFWSSVEAWGELAGGVLLVLGFLTPFAASFIVGDMLVAILKVHAARGLWSQTGGYEYNLVLIGLMLALGLMGPGLYALDGRLRFRLARPAVFAVALAATLAGVAFLLLGITIG
jgi:putative oxidoreductase